MNDRATTCAFTGHRPNKLGGYGYSPLTARLYDALCWKIWDAYSVGYRTFISGMAQGFDQAAAELIIRLRKGFPDVRLVAAVPFTGQARPWPRVAQNSYHKLLEQADEIKVVSGGEYAAWKMQTRNEYMVNRSSLVIAAWDGTSGGTANCVHYARSVNVKVALIDVAALRGEMAE